MSLGPVADLKALPSAGFSEVLLVGMGWVPAAEWDDVDAVEREADGISPGPSFGAAARTGRRDDQVSVLEVVDENTPDDTMERIGSCWKNKLCARQSGLNRD